MPTSRASEHFDWLGRFFGADLPASNTRTRELMGWEPTSPGLLADLEELFRECFGPTLLVATYTGEADLLALGAQWERRRRTRLHPPQW